jgi:hypothetical protein
LMVSPSTDNRESSLTTDPPDTHFKTYFILAPTLYHSRLTTNSRPRRPDEMARTRRDVSSFNLLYDRNDTINLLPTTYFFS